MANIDQLELPNGTTYDITDNRLAVQSVDNLPQDIASFDGAAALPLSSLKVAINPIQDLHGYDSPWVGGSGRNLFDMSVWQGTAASGLSFAVDEDFVTINGTKSGATYVTPSGNFKTLPSGTYYAKAFVIGGTTSNTPSVYIYTDSDLTSNIIGSEKSFILESDTSVKFRFAFWSDGATFSNYKVGIVISKTSNIDTFAPYSNICPISGWDSVTVTRTGKNLLNPKLYSGLSYNLPEGTTVNITESSEVVTPTADGFSYEIPTNWWLFDFKTAPLKAGTYRIQLFLIQ